MEDNLSDKDKEGCDHMERKHDNQFIGVILILLGFYWACRSLGLVHFRIFFDGWWTFLIMIPCLLNFIQGKSRGTSLGGLILGGMLLLWRQDFIPGAYIPAIFLSLVFILIGISIMMNGPKQHTTQNAGSATGTGSSYQRAEYGGGADSDHQGKEYQWNNESQQSKEYQWSNESQQNSGSQWGNETQQNKEYYQEREHTWSYDEEKNGASGASNAQSGTKEEHTFHQNYSTFETCPPSISAILVGKSVSCLSGVFRGTSVQSILGNVQLDLRQAVLEQDVYVNVNLILGGADIFLPENARVICETQSILGDVRDVRKYEMNHSPTQPAIHIVGTCILGGLELK